MYIHLFCLKPYILFIMSNTNHPSRSLNYYVMMYVVIFTCLATVAVAAETLFIK